MVVRGLREKLVQIALEWESTFGVAPSITSTLSEYDAAKLVGYSDEEYLTCMIGSTAVKRGHDFRFAGKRYQVKANRPSGKPGSPVTLVSKVRNFEWDFLIWVLYDCKYVIQEAWLWEVRVYEDLFASITRLSLGHMRQGKSIF